MAKTCLFQHKNMPKITGFLSFSTHGFIDCDAFFLFYYLNETMHLNIVENLPITYCSIFCVRKSLGQSSTTRHSSRKHFVPCTWLVFSRKKIFLIQKGMCCTTKTHRKQESGLLIFSCEKTFGVKYPAAPGSYMF